MGSGFPGSDDSELMAVIDALYVLNRKEGHEDFRGQFSEDQVCSESGLAPDAFAALRVRLGVQQFWFARYTNGGYFLWDWGIKEAVRRAAVRSKAEAERQQQPHRRALRWFSAKAADTAISTLVSTVVATAVATSIARCSMPNHPAEERSPVTEDQSPVKEVTGP